MDIESTKISNLLDDLVEYARDATSLREGEFTIKDYIEKCKAEGIEIQYGTAKNKLNRLVAEGKLKVRKMPAKPRGEMNVYSAK
mgnify:CR=1 FL=1